MNYSNMDTNISEEHEMIGKKNGLVNNGVKNSALVYERVSLTEKVPKVKNKKEEFVQSFSVHGLSRICTGSRKESVFWTCVVLIGVTLASYVIYDLASKYFRYEVYTTVNKHVTNKNILPKVIFCDFNLMKKKYFAYCGVDTTNPYIKHPEAGKPCVYSNITEQPEIKNILTNNNHEWSNGLFHVTKCFTYGGTHCASDEYIQSIQLMDNSCFSLNWNGNLVDPYSQVTIEFEVNDTYRIPYSSIMTTVQQYDVEEVEKQHSVFIEPYKNYHLTVKKTKIKRLPHPFPSKCITTTENYIFPGKYSRTLCIQSLGFLNMLKYCGDTLDHPRRFMSPKIMKKYGHPNQSIADTLSCIDRYSRKRVTLDTKLCPVCCEEMEIETTFTYHELKRPKRKVYSVHIQLQESDSYKIIEEKQLFTWEQIAGQIGGFLGLVVGASFISIIEIFAYIGLCLVLKCKKKIKIII